MHKYLITHKTTNQVTGAIMVTTSPRMTCPFGCALRKHGNGPLAGLCYAEHGALGGFVWTALDRAEPGKTVLNGVRVYGLAELLYEIRQLPTGSLWRHNIAGDLPSFNRTTIDHYALRALVAANKKAGVVSPSRTTTYSPTSLIAKQSKKPTATASE